MTYTEIKDLLASGFTPEQITALTTSAVPIAADHNTDPVDSQDPEVSPAEGSGEVVQPDDHPDPDAGQDSDGLREIRETLSQLQQENKQLREMMQSNNIRDRTTDTPGIPEVSAEDILSGLIRPVYDQKGGRS